MDRHTPDYLSEDAKQSYRQTRALIQRWHHRDGWGYAITPRFAPTSPPSCSPRSACSRGFPGYLDADPPERNPNEVAWVSDLWPEHERYLDVYHHYGLTASAACLPTRFTFTTASGSACMTPVRRWRFAPPLTCFSAAGCFACPPAGSTRCGWASAPTSRGHHLQHAAHPGGGLQGRPASELPPARQRGVLSRHAGRRARPQARR